MRPTRCQLRYSRLKIIVIRARMRLRWPCDLLLTIRTARLARVFEFASTLRRNVHYRTIAALLKDTLYTVWRRGSAAEPLQKQIVVASSIDAARACEWRRQQQAAWPRSCGSSPARAATMNVRSKLTNRRLEISAPMLRSPGEPISKSVRCYKHEG